MDTPNTDQNVDTLRADLNKLRDDLAALTRKVSGAASTEAKARTAQLQERIEQNPFTAILVAFGVGYVIGRMRDG
jgi:ElaB/YqjD/DUF883 family membrane-anchored ribosome-binding protein